MDGAERYEWIELLVKTRTDGEDWYTRLFDFIAADCQGTYSEDNEDEAWLPCTCGLETMFGSSGTLDECYARSTSVGSGLQPIDLARVIVFLAGRTNLPEDEAVLKVVKWADDEIYFEENWDAAPLADELGDDFREMTNDDDDRR